ncbi:MAG TPA: hypothetical protein VFO98_04820 [Marmoricola sp.]|jgi:hypothetical protein|nr:hypothetical protein [Marmoricola sp.]
MPERTDDQLLDAIASLWQLLDPPPADLAEGVLSRLAAEDLELELLTLVSDTEPAGIRSIGTATDDQSRAVESGNWLLEYAGAGFHVHLRIARSDGIARVDGWLDPAKPMSVRISTERPYRILQQAEVDERGRFELVGCPTGLCRLIFVEPERTGRPNATPPFWI